jgi:hypothetical protein
MGVIWDEQKREASLSISQNFAKPFIEARKMLIAKANL